MLTLLIIRFFLRKRCAINFSAKYKCLFLVLIIMFLSFSATPQVTANFTTINSVTGCGSLLVEFQDLSLGIPTSWLWDFGNGNTSTLKNPVALYSAPGIYDVVLKVSDLVTNDIRTAIAYVKVYEEPSISLQANSAVLGCVPLTVSFEDLLGSANVINSWQWDFGDGGSSSIQNPDYTYNTHGQFSVSLSVIDSNGCQSLFTALDLVEVNKVPVADFTADIVHSCDSAELVSFSNYSLNSSVFLWDFGDGGISSLLNPSHYFSPGTFSVTLYAHEGSCVDTLFIEDLIEVVGLFSPIFSVDTNSGCQGLSVSFNDLTTNNPNDFFWDFGDGSTSVLQNPTHIFDSEGIYDITLTTSVSGQCITSVVFPSEIQIFSHPQISLAVDTNIGCILPFNVGFYDNTLDAVNWSWNFGDGNVSNMQNPSNNYTVSGIFDVSLSVINNNGCESSIVLDDYIEVNDLPAADFSVTPILSCVGEDIFFSDSSAISTNNWQWSFGNGDSSLSQNPTYQYLSVGVYDVTLISSVNNCQDTLVLVDCVKIIEPAAIFEESHHCDNPLEVEFLNMSIGFDDLLWDFGNGDTSILENPTYTFSSYGLHNVNLTVSNNLTGCSHTYMKQIKLTQPIADFDYFTLPGNVYGDSVGCVPHTVYISNNSQDYAWFKMFWGDGYVGYDPVHHFTDTGVFDVTMIVTDIYGCKDTAVIEDMYHMHDLHLEFSVSDVSGCDSMLVEFELDYNQPLLSMIWDFGDGSSSIIENPQNLYHHEGNYDVSLYAKSIYGCKDTVQQLEYVRFQHPEANLVVSNQNACIGDEIQFSNLSSGISVNYFWDFGDGTLSNLSSPNHTFFANGVYDINLSVTDSFGCTDHLILSNYIQVLSPIADFSLIPLTSNCPPLITDFVNLSTSDVVNYKWDFGDGSVSFLENPSHLFSSSGLFDVSLMVENIFGCRDTLSEFELVDMSGIAPSGYFVISDSLICKDDSVYFYPNVSDVDYFLWDFGNGIFSNDSVAIGLYSDTGIFIPNLIIQNTSGCQLILNSDDTIKVNHIVIDAGPDLELCEGESVQLNALGNSFDFIWSPVNMLSSSDINNPLASPIVSSTYYVTHTDGICSASDSVFIDVHNDIPIAYFSASGHCEGDLTSFIANSGLPGISISYSWSFGQEGEMVSLALDTGDNIITLIVENLDNSCKDTFEYNVEIFANPVVDFTLTDEVCLGDSALFIDNSSNNIDVWLYNFGDGFGSSGNQDPIYIYSEPGVFNVSLEIVSDVGCEASTNKDIYIHNLPTVDFLIEDNCEGTGNVFTNLSSVLNGAISSIKYDFNDILIAEDSVVAHVFPGYGLFSVELTAFTLAGCRNSTIKTTQVFANPVVDFSVSKSCVGESTLFKNHSFVPNASISSCAWQFSSESSSSLINPDYTFLSDGVFNVSLLVLSSDGCESALTEEIIVAESPSPLFEVDSDVCIADTVKFSTLDSTIVQWHYDFGDGNHSLDKNPLNYYYHSGVFDVSLEVTSLKGCKNDTTIVNAINVHDLPIINFQPSMLFTSELNSEIKFYNYSLGAYAFEWDFGSGDFSVEEEPNYHFNNPGIYEVMLTASDSIGCTAEMVKAIEIYPEHTLFIANAFTPDGDGLNDVFMPSGNSISFYEMKIFDRWGGVLFQSESIDLGWDGINHSGEYFDNGIYLYSINLYDNNGRLWVYNGELSLMR